MSAPNPAPYSRPYRPRSIFGPLVLITIGVLFLLRNIGVISYHSLGWWFLHYWPVVLIVWGAAKLVEYFWAQHKGYPTPRLGAGGIVFLVFFIMCGMTATGISNLNLKGLGDELGNDPNIDFFGDIFGANYAFTDNFAQPLEKATQIKVLCRLGDINVTPSQDDQAHAFVHKNLRSDSQESANRLNDSTHAKFQQQGSTWILDLTSGEYERGRFNLDLQLPRNAVLSLSTRRGNITVSERTSSLDLSTDRGDVSVEQVTGDASVHLKHGSLTAKKITGNVSVDGTVNDSTISDVGGTLTLTGTYWGDMQLARIAKQTHFSSSRTDLQFARLDGEFNMEPDSLHATTITGPFKLDTRSKSVHLDDVSGDVHIDNRNASVEVRPKGPLGNIDVSNVHGEIDVNLPANAGFQLDAQSIGGVVQSDFSVSVDNSGRNATAKGTVGKGGPEVRLKADHGTIQIRKQ